MRTTLEEGQRVLVDKLTPRFAGYSRGDIVVFNPVRRASCSDPTGVALPGGTPYIKRLIGEAGDRIDLRDGDVYVNGERLDEPYVGDFGSGTGLSWDVAEGRLFVMGDNRPGSIDSRSDEIGQICINDVVGKAFLRYWPFDKLSLLQAPNYSARNP
jgi:signal peptidase I